jgi:hypothetical protein
LLLVSSAAWLPGDLTAAGLPDGPVQVAKLVASDGAPSSTLGRGVSLEGDTAIVGAPYADVDGIADQGAAYIYYRNRGGPDAWGQVAKLTASDGATYELFGSVALSGDTAVVGAPFAGGGYHGRAYVYYRNQGGPDAWGQVAILTASDGAYGDFYGGAVAVDGDTIMIGANQWWLKPGAVYVYYRNQGGPDAWGQVAKLTASDGGGNEYFGGAVALDGDTAVIAAPMAPGDGAMAQQGAVYVFYRDQGGPDAWGEVTKLTTPDAIAWGAFGSRVSLSGDTTVVGSLPTRNQNQQGAAYVFYRNQGGPDAWGQVAKLTAPANAPDHMCFGIAAVSGDTALVGAYYDGGFCHLGLNSAYIYHRNQGGPDAWGQAAELTPDDVAAGDSFGAEVSLSGGTAIVGAWLADVGGNVDQGAAYVFDGVQANQPPVAAASGPYTAIEGGSVTLDGSGSYDPDPGDTLTYAWDLDNDGVYETPGATPDFAGLDGPASHPVTLQVCDSQAACDSDTTTVAVTNVGPTANAGADVTVYRNETVALVGTWADPAAALDEPYAWSWDLDGDGAADVSGADAYGATGPATAIFAIEGVYDLTFTVTDADGDRGQDTVRITVLNHAPDCAAAAASPARLWPPNNKFVPVAIGGTTDADGDALTLAITSIRQDEPVGKGNSAPDGKGIGGATAELRAEKLGSGNGRFYHVSFTASDGHGGACTGVVRVAVPHDQAKPASDGGPLYDSTVPTP